MSDQSLHALPSAGGENGGVFTGVRLALVPNRAGIQNVGQKPPQRVLREWAALAELTRLTRPAFEPPASTASRLKPRRNQALCGLRDLPPGDSCRPTVFVFPPARRRGC